MKNKWKNYALKDGKIQNSYIREYSSRSPNRQAREASSRNSLLKSRQDQNKEEVKLVYREPNHYKVIQNPQILNDAWVINLKREPHGESKTGIGNPIQGSREVSSEVRSIKPSGSSSSGGDEKVRKRKDGKDGTSRKKKV